MSVEYNFEVQDEPPIYEEKIDTGPFQETGKFEVIITPDEDIIIGENHLRLEYDALFQDKFDGYMNGLKSGDIVIVEHHTNPSQNIWSAESRIPRFMQLAELYPNNKNGIGLVVLDGDMEARRELQKNNFIELTGISKSDYDYLIGLRNAYYSILTKDGPKGYMDSIMEDSTLSNDEKSAYMKGVTKFISILTSDSEIDKKEALSGLVKMINYHTKIDAILRDIDYQEQINSIKEKNPSAKLFIVVGNQHMDSIQEVLENREISAKVTKEEIAEFMDLLENYK